ncbi:MAG: hypothetical protein GX446_11775, partial [Chthonomonadales bacterium]|nr:hypothetical protein [Chthonomonadales bacterium]
ALTGSDDTTVRLWDVETGKELCQLLSFRDGTWAVVDPEGRYDASNDGEVEWLCWVRGLEVIPLEQVMSRYYHPGLLARILGFSKEPLRDV